MKINSYMFDQYRNRHHERELLDIRAARGLEQLIPNLVSAGLKPDMRVIDVGSGTGIRAIEIAAYLKQGQIVGIDFSSELLSAFRERLESMKVHNVVATSADVSSLNSLVELGQFDFAYVRLVIQHLKDPLSALQNIKSLLKPGGILFIEDTDRDWLSISPSNPRWEKLYEEVKHAQGERGGDPRTGRKLGLYLKNIELQNVNVMMVPVCGGNEVVADWIEYYAPSYFNHLDDMKAAEASLIMSDLKNQCGNEPMFFYQTWFQAWGQKA